jgi:single-strand DNA-binding protein
MSNLNFNRCIIAGRICDVPELKQTNSGTSFVSFRMAVNRKTREENKADFIPVTAWRETAEFISKYFAKGSPILIEGALTSRDYTTKDGSNRTAYEVVADRVYFVDSKSEEIQTATRPQNTQPKYEVVDSNEDLPF